MSRQEDACWHCGARWEDEDTPAPTLRLIPGGAEEPAGAAAPPDDGYAAVAAAALPVPRP